MPASVELLTRAPMGLAYCAFVAGIVEGEGYLGVLPNKTRTGKRVRLCVAMTDADTVFRVHRWTGVGHVHGPYHSASRGEQRKPRTDWIVQRKDELEWLLPQLIPFLGKRRRVAAHAVLVALAGIHSRVKIKRGL